MGFGIWDLGFIRNPSSECHPERRRIFFISCKQILRLRLRMTQPLVILSIAKDLFCIPYSVFRNPSSARHPERSEGSFSFVTDRFFACGSEWRYLPRHSERSEESIDACHKTDSSPAAQNDFSFCHPEWNERSWYRFFACGSGWRRDLCQLTMEYEKLK